jgi:hypothetical protein
VWLANIVERPQRKPSSTTEQQKKPTNFVITKKNQSHNAWFSLFTFDRKASFFYGANSSQG